MSYPNGIGGLQQLLDTSEIAAGKTNGAAKTAPSAASALGLDPAGGANATDQANLSAEGSLMAQALSGSDVRTDKVAVLQQSIAAGTYNVSSSDVADKVINALTK